MGLKRDKILSPQTTATAAFIKIEQGGLVVPLPILQRDSHSAETSFEHLEC